MHFFALLAAGGLGYLLGSIPFGLIFVQWATGKDLRQIGSGRTGGTNSLRAAGLKIGLATTLCDIGKGLLAVLLSKWLFGSPLPAPWLPWALSFTGVMCVVGHNWSLYLGFRGGAGTTPNIGWAMALWWPMLPLAVIGGGGLLYGVGMASVASIAVGLMIPSAFLLLFLTGTPGFDQTYAYFVAGLVTFIVVLWALRPNLKRLLQGNERIVGPRARRTQP